MLYNYEDRNISGIYQIKNLVNNKIYIGSTNNLYLRFLDHRAELRGNYHVNKHLQNAWNKYGEHNFVFNILQICEENREMLFDLEQWYVDILKPEYNISIEVINQPQKTLKTRLKQSETRKRLYKENKLNVFKKPIYLYYKDGSFVGKFDSGIEAARYIHTTPDKISEVARGKWVQIKGYKAFYFPQDYITPFEKPKAKRPKILKYYDIIENGNIIYSGNINQISEYLNITISTLRHYVNPKKPHKAKNKYIIKSRAAL